jgi:beta-glucosidase
MMQRTLGLAIVLSAALAATLALAAPAKPWMNRKLSPARRAELVLKAMTQDEKLTLVSGYFATPASFQNDYQPPKGVRINSAGYVPGIARLGLPAQWETDAGIGVATQRSQAPRERTALPSGLATAATWDPKLAEAGGAMIGAEARASGFNVMLAGGVNLAREPRNGRNFEYGGEDPLLAGTMVGAQIKGIQSNHIISTIKHFALNDQETGRTTVSVRLAEDQARMSDLLAFQIAIEVGDPGSVMCAYNRIDGVYACESDHLLNQVLKRDWGYRGYVMSDWGAVHSTVDAANHGLDQQSAASFDKENYFRAPLKQAVAAGTVPRARLDDMTRRILWAMFAKGVVDHPVADAPETIDFAAHEAVSRADAEGAIVLLKNAGGILPLAKTARKIAIIGGHADVGVMSGGGSSQVYPRGGAALTTGPDFFPGPELYFPSSPMTALQARAPQASITYADGKDTEAAAKLAAGSDVVIAFATQWSAEAFDPAFTLRSGQDALIAAVAKANPKTVVVLETGNAVAMPWLDQVAGVVEAWFPGAKGGEAIASVLSGAVNPSGRLPVTFPKSEDQLPHQEIAKGADVDYTEGAAAGYKWFDKTGAEPLFPFGHGLSYTSFEHAGLKAIDGETLSVTFTVRNSGKARGQDVAQVYVSPKVGGWEAPKRLAGFRKVDLAPGATTTVTLAVDPRLLATYDGGQWKIAGGTYEVMLGASSRDLPVKTTVTLKARTWSARAGG